MFCLGPFLRIGKSYIRFIIQQTAGDHVKDNMKHKYKVILDLAFEEGIKPEDVVDFIKKQGGINKHATMKASAPPRRYSSIIIASTASASRWQEFLIPTARECIPTMAAWYRISSCKRLRGEPITIYGDGSQTRSFGFVDDLVEGVLRLMSTDDTVLGPINLGNPNEVSVRDLVELIIAMTGSRSTLVFKPLPADDPKQRLPDISLAREKLGWMPKVQLRDGLKRSIDYFKLIV